MDTLAALTDPTRRRIVELLAQGRRMAGELVAQYPISQSVVSRYLRVLREAEIVETVPSAQSRIYRLRPESLDALDAWLTQGRRLWANRLGVS